MFTVPNAKRRPWLHEPGIHKNSKQSIRKVKMDPRGRQFILCPQGQSGFNRPTQLREGSQPYVVQSHQTRLRSGLRVSGSQDPQSKGVQTHFQSLLHRSPPGEAGLFGGSSSFYQEFKLESPDETASFGPWVEQRQLSALNSKLRITPSPRQGEWAHPPTHPFSLCGHNHMSTCVALQRHL